MAPPKPLQVVGDELEAVRLHVRKIADMIGLRDHTFRIEVAMLPDGVRATCSCEDVRAYSKIRLDESFFDLSMDEQHEALIHEVLHPLLHRLMVHVTDLRDELGRRQFEAVERGFSRDMERVVDRLAIAFSRLIEPNYH